MATLRTVTRDFWRWYERHYTVNVAVAACLFGLQLVHLVWLTGQPLAEHVLGDAIFTADGPLRWLIVLIDYTEIPALLSVSLVYVNDLRQGASIRPVLYLLFLNSQWLHIFWITDEFVVSSAEGDSSALPAWLAYVAILIDYLELPVIYDTVMRAAVNLRKNGLSGLRPAPLPGDAGESGPEHAARLGSGHGRLCEQATMPGPAVERPQAEERADG